jgi:hypothetical protein
MLAAPVIQPHHALESRIEEAAFDQSHCQSGGVRKHGQIAP